MTDDQIAELERVVQREWRCVNAETEGIGYVATEREHGRNARFNAEGWLETLGPKYRLELWERTYYVTSSEYRQLQIDGSRLGMEGEGATPDPAGKGPGEGSIPSGGRTALPPSEAALSTEM